MFRGQKNVENAPKEPVSVSNQPAVQPTKTAGESTKSPEIQITIDTDVNHWQTKETEFFTIKFPKEWYWLESSHSENEGYSRIITSNPNFPINKYAEIGLSMGADYVLTNDTEIVMPFSVAATSDVGTPQQSIDSSFRGTKRQYVSAECGYLSAISDTPIVAHCSSVDKNDQKVQLYFIANKVNKVIFYARTAENNALQKDILDNIAKNIVVKDSL